MSQMNVYAVFYLNLMFSSISVENRATVIKKCFWPLLELIEEGYPLALQPSGITLEIIQELDPAWIQRCKTLLAQGKCEIVGDGYSHIIAPLVPAEVNRYNQKLGRDMYQEFLDVKPTVATVTEMVYSSGVVEHYKDAGYGALLMEWNNPRQYHPEWKNVWRYYRQNAIGSDDKSLALLWADTIAFQKFQRYVHGEMEIDGYMEYVRSHKEKAPPGGSFCIYASDAEIFDFRPGRYHTEAKIGDEGEWNRIRALLEAIKKESGLRLVHPSEVLQTPRSEHSDNALRLESARQAIVVKKQEKYNPTRWAVTGRDSIGINTLCYRVYKALRPHPGSPLWKDLCYVWGSDSRTHSTEARFTEYRTFLDELLHKAEALGKSAPASPIPPQPITVVREGNFLHCKSGNMNAVFNVRRGLAIHTLTFPEVSPRPLIGTIPHGYYEDVTLAADFYSDNTIIDVPARMRITDLEPADITVDEEQGIIEGTIKTIAGEIKKQITFLPNSLRISYDFHLSLSYPLLFRTGMVTPLPDAFNRDSLFFRCHNGGEYPETFMLKDVKSISSEPLSLLVSARAALGNTTGVFDIGDRAAHVRVRTDLQTLAAIPIVTYKETDDTFYFRVAHSLAEVDDTAKVRADTPLPHFKFSMELSAYLNT